MKLFLKYEDRMPGINIEIPISLFKFFSRITIGYSVKRFNLVKTNTPE